jgi:predicted transcriptional regulator
MMTQRELGSLPDALDSTCAKLVYLSLATAGGATVEELQSCLDVSSMTLFSVLSTLEDRGLVADEDGVYYPATGENSPLMSQEWRQ